MSVYEELLERIRALAIIDSHQHLSPEESDRTSIPMDALSLYAQYTRFPMMASGLSQEDWQRMHDPELPIQQRWALAKPHIENIRHTAFNRVVQLTLKHFWDIDKLTDDNIVEVSQMIAADNTPGIYRRVLKDHCNIVKVVNQDADRSNAKSLELYKGQNLLLPLAWLIDSWPDDLSLVNRVGALESFATLEDYLQWARLRIKALAEAGAVAYKMVCLDHPQPDHKEAQQQFLQLKKLGQTLPRNHSPSILLSVIQEEMLKSVAHTGLPVSVHTGFGINRNEPIYMAPILSRHRSIHFDLLHAGVPHVRQMGQIVIEYPNTSLNLCWSHSINPAMICRALDEYIDALGMDKIIAFGGDTRPIALEKTYGHLELARRNIAEVLAQRIEKGLLDLDGAMVMAKKWFFDNPTRVYGIQLKEDQ